MYFLGIDGGGTRTSFVLIDEKGNLISAIEKGNSDYLAIGIKAFKAVLEEGIREVCQDITDKRPGFTFFGIPNYGEREDDMPEIEKAVQEIMGNKRYKCGNDVEAGWAGSLGCQPGIHLVAGTGAIGYGRDKYGNTARSSGWGHYFGDEGSAYWLGKRLLQLFAKEADGRLEKTLLYQLVREKFQIDNDFELLSVIDNRIKNEREEVASLAVLVHQAAEQGDKTAQSLFKKAALELSLIVRAINHRLKFKAEKVTVSYSGGVFNAGEYILNPLKESLADEMVLKRPLLPPELGAALYAIYLNSNKGINNKIVARLGEEQPELDM